MQDLLHVECCLGVGRRLLPVRVVHMDFDLAVRCQDLQQLRFCRREFERGEASIQLGHGGALRHSCGLVSLELTEGRTEVNLIREDKVGWLLEVFDALKVDRKLEGVGSVLLLCCGLGCQVSRCGVLPLI